MTIQANFENPDSIGFNDVMAITFWKPNLIARQDGKVYVTEGTEVDFPASLQLSEDTKAELKAHFYSLMTFACVIVLSSISVSVVFP